MSQQQQVQLNMKLKQFAQSLGPSRDCKDGAKSAAQQVFVYLQQHSRFSLARFKIVGSVGKSTALRSFDLDLVVFVNGVMPPFWKLIDEWEEILQDDDEEDEDRPDIDIQSSNNHCLSLTLDGYKIDLLPAVNYSDAGDLQTQTQGVLDQIRRMPYKSALFSTSLCEYHLQFMSQKSAFVHELCRLAKFWNRSVFINEYISGRSTLIEMIAVHAGLEVEQRGGAPVPMLTAFRRFLSLVASLRSLNIRFATDFSSRTPDSVLQQRPLVIDPANPYNNFAHGLSQEAVTILVKSAERTLSDFGGVYRAMRPTFVPLDVLLALQGDFHFSRSNVNLWFVTAGRLEDDDEDAAMPAWSEGYDSDVVFQFLRHTLFTRVQAYVESRSQRSAGEIGEFEMEEMIQRWIDQTIYGQNERDPSRWTHDTNDYDHHDDFQLTISIPYAQNGSIHSLLKVSLNIGQESDDDEETETESDWSSE